MPRLLLAMLNLQPIQDRDAFVMIFGPDVAEDALALSINDLLSKR